MMLQLAAASAAASVMSWERRIVPSSLSEREDLRMPITNDVGRDGDGATFYRRCERPVVRLIALERDLVSRLRERSPYDDRRRRALPGDCPDHADVEFESVPRQQDPASLH